MKKTSPANILTSNMFRPPRYLGFEPVVLFPKPGSTGEELFLTKTVGTAEAVVYIILIRSEYAEIRKKWLHDPGRGEVFQRVRACVMPPGSKRQRREDRNGLLGSLREISLVGRL